MYIKKTAVFCKDGKRGIISAVGDGRSNTFSAKLYNVSPEDELIISFVGGEKVTIKKLQPIMSGKISSAEDFACMLTYKNGKVIGKTAGFSENIEETFSINDIIIDDVIEVIEREEKSESSETPLNPLHNDTKINDNEEYNNASPEGDIENSYGNKTAEEVNASDKDNNEAIAPNNNKDREQSPQDNNAEDAQGKVAASTVSEETTETFPDIEEMGFEGEIARVNYYENVAAEKYAQSPEGFLESERERAEKSFYYGLKPQLDELFAKFPPDEYLNSVIPSSSWVKIDYDGDGKSYSVGLLTDGEDVLFIGYGISSTFKEAPPNFVKSVAQWVPKDFANPKEEGYWMIYQKATDGENA